MSSPGSDTVVSRDPCPRCGSRNNLVRYADGHAHCYSPGCQYFEKGDGLVTQPQTIETRRQENLLDPKEGTWKPLEKRRLNAETLRRYGYFLSNYSGKTVQVAPYHDQHGKVAAQKLRTPEKSFIVLKGETYEGINRCKLFGQQVYGDKFDKRVVITEGEIDAMSIAQAMEFKLAAVSVGHGAQGAADHLKANWRWLDSFAEIILCFDDDEPGQKAAEQCAKLFSVGKVKIATIPGFKDASEALQANRPGDIVGAVYGAETWRPRGIVNAADCFSRDFADETPLKAWTYPWPTLEAMTGGLLAGQCVILVAGTGMGKSVIVSELIVDLANKQDAKVGYMAFEATRREAQEGLMSIVASRRVHLENLSREQREAIHKETFAARRIELYDQETAERSLDAILGYVRYMAKGLDCKVVVVDPLSFVVAGVELSADERRVLDKVARDFASMAKELDIAIVVTHHLTRPREGKGFEEGRHITLDNIRGSAGIAAFASTVIGLEGNQQGPCPNLRRFRVAKCRRAGRTGIADRLEFSFETGRYTTTDVDYEAAEKNDGPQTITFGGALAQADY